MMEERIINRFKTVAMGFYPFKVELKDFGSFPSHTIYINVTTKEPVRLRGGVEVSRARQRVRDVEHVENAVAVGVLPTDFGHGRDG